MLRIMRFVMQDIDGALAGMARRDTVVAADSAGQEDRRLSVWLQDGVPRKLAVTEPDEGGRMTGESAFWFVNGEVRVVQQAHAAFALDADRILLWTDEVLVPLTDVTDAERMTRERELVALAARWLGAFGLAPP